MPIFDYLCPDCGSAFERLVPRADSAVICPACDKPARKQLSVFAAPSGSAVSSGGGDACACYPTGGG